MVAPGTTPGRREIRILLAAHSEVAVVRMEKPIHMEAPVTVERGGNADTKAGTAWRSRYHPTVKRPNSTATVRARRASARAAEAAIPAAKMAIGNHEFGPDPKPLNTR